MRELRMVVIAASLIVAGGKARAGDLPARWQVDLYSRQHGLGIANIQLLEVLKAPGRDVVATSLLSVLKLPDPGRSDDGVRHRAEGGGFSLLVYADGDRVTFRDRVVQQALRLNPLPANGPVPVDTLVAWGKAFVETQLSKRLSFPPTETLVPLKTRYQHLIVQSEADGTSYHDSIVSSIIIFGRAVNGVLIVGPGSKIAVEFANDGRVAGFDYDWVQLKAHPGTQSVLGLNALIGRSLLFKADPRKAEVQNFECGYYDVGSRDRQTALVQAGCVAYVVTKATSHPVTGEAGEMVTSARISAIPAGSTVIADAAWPEATKICSQQGTCSDPGRVKSVGRPRPRR